MHIRVGLLSSQTPDRGSPNSNSQGSGHSDETNVGTQSSTSGWLLVCKSEIESGESGSISAGDTCEWCAGGSICAGNIASSGTMCHGTLPHMLGMQGIGCTHRCGERLEKRANRNQTLSACVAKLGLLKLIARVCWVVGVAAAASVGGLVSLSRADPSRAHSSVLAVSFLAAVASFEHTVAETANAIFKVLWAATLVRSTKQHNFQPALVPSLDCALVGYDGCIKVITAIINSCTRSGYRTR